MRMKKYFIFVFIFFIFGLRTIFAATNTTNELNSQYKLLNSLNIVKVINVSTSQSSFSLNTKTTLIAQALCQNITIYLDATGNVSIPEDAVNNGSTGTMLTFDTDITAFTCADIGPNPVILTVTDIDSTSDTCTATVTVLDNLPPTATNPADINVH
jgi:hypothetical protein